MNKLPDEVWDEYVNIVQSSSGDIDIIPTWSPIASATSISIDNLKPSPDVQITGDVTIDGKIINKDLENKLKLMVWKMMTEIENLKEQIEGLKNESARK